MQASTGGSGPATDRPRETGGWRGRVRDIVAGVSLASMNIPQVLGYTRIAAMPAVTGLYTVLLPLVAFACFGASRHLVVAADSATAAIFSSALGRMAPPGSPHYMALVSMVALLSAGFLLVARLFRLGFLADFLSRTVLVGFMAGVGIQVALAMTRDMLGVTTTAHNPVLQLVQTLTHLRQASVPSMALSICVVGLILAGNRLAPRAPLALVTVVASMTFGLTRYGIETIGPIESGLPHLRLPDVSWNDMLALLPVSTSCVFVIIAQSAATSRAFALRFHDRMNDNADILGLCAANAVAGLSGTFTVNGSPTQTAMAVRAGARSQLAQLTFAAVTMCVLLFLTAPLHYLPRCVLASIVFTVAVGMIDVRAMRAIRRESPGEYGLALVTAAAVVGIGVEQGIFLAIALSLFRHVRHSYEPHTMILRYDVDSGLLEPGPVAAGRQTAPGLVVYRFCADLFYANSARFVGDVRLLLEHPAVPVACLVIDASAITDVDFSAASDLRDLFGDLARRNVSVIFGRVSPYLRADMDRHRITPVVGAQNIHAQLHTAIAAARAIIGARHE
ncbi:SulP family inorganic anion transporter [Komagataeibacter sp. FNDCR2]|uniref:SulP family inorganic anion transporter n=1 Tax=Komagataeibacter sp. FNDCR2 TaxID=2878682 RepID=UPI001E64F4EF|nr:SulP family inorganic anion transporter [Komagataeibacter sp. FNDCR2]MCE2575377.1 SulP family inorganic anion transporter [Komagataeibacter sp. FNDCR2]